MKKKITIKFSIAYISIILSAFLLVGSLYSVTFVDVDTITDTPEDKTPQHPQPLPDLYNATPTPPLVEYWEETDIVSSD